MKLTLDILKPALAEIEKIVWFLGYHAFSLILLLVIIDFIFGGVVFYNNVFMAEQAEPKVSGSILKFDVKTYYQVLIDMQARAQGKGNLKVSQPDLSE
ncbi:MAG: hypothetical protein NT155_01210 [Candidatus Staskawiczbacteria bacterium]|nr:hypothetical protein [Candidatus Staskawiczbacteria bacterium]